MQTFEQYVYSFSFQNLALIITSSVMSWWMMMKMHVLLILLWYPY